MSNPAPRHVIVTSYYAARRNIPWYAIGVRCAYLFLPEAIRKQLCFVVVANDISDRTAALLRLALKGLPYRLLRVERESLYASWNRAVLSTPSAYAYAFWNVDDMRFAGSLAEQFMLCEDAADEPQLVIGPHIEVWYQRWPFGVGWRRWEPSPGTPSPFFCINRPAFEAIGLFSGLFRISGDTEWYARYQECGFKPVYSSRIAGIFVDHGKGLSTRYSRERIAEDLLVQYLHPGFKRSILSMFEDLKDQYVLPPSLPAQLDTREF